MRDTVCGRARADNAAASLRAAFPLRRRKMGEEGTMPLADWFRAMARNNAWSNYRLYGACAGLTQAELEAKRTSFFPTLQLTLNHILLVDLFYLDGLESGGRGLAIFANEIAHERIAELARAQADTDLRMVRFCDRLDEAALAREIELDRGDEGLTREAVHAVLAHLFVHQIHHRGQVHAMLSGTRVAPPQLDEFFLAWDEPRRAKELAALGLPPAR
ncbi:MAG TPA: DinB family protein [Myxococcota bacterium]|nr:DinB family protein [Myxococcota bacterium]